MPASSKELGGLHAQLARVLNSMLEPVLKTRTLKEATDEEEAVMEQYFEYPRDGTLAVAAKFLKDNSIFSGVDEDEERRLEPALDGTARSERGTSCCRRRDEDRRQPGLATLGTA